MRHLRLCSVSASAGAPPSVRRLAQPAQCATGSEFADFNSRHPNRRSRMERDDTVRIGGQLAQLSAIAIPVNSAPVSAR
jgi:hypothetical protein